MKTTFLEFEQPIAELETRIEELRFVQDDSAVDISDEIQRLTKRSQSQGRLRERRHGAALERRGVLRHHGLGPAGA